MNEKTLAQIVYEQFVQETSPMLSLPWDQLPNFAKQAWENVVLKIQGEAH